MEKLEQVRATFIAGKFYTWYRNEKNRLVLGEFVPEDYL